MSKESVRIGRGGDSSSLVTPYREAPRGSKAPETIQRQIELILFQNCVAGHVKGQLSAHCCTVCTEVVMS